ncbi:MAG: hypothetical protein ACI4WY_12080 [Anaerovoracaceae bacterium]
MDLIRQLKKERRVEAELLNYYEAEAKKYDSACRLIVRNRKNGKREYYVKHQGCSREIYLGRNQMELVKKLQHQRLCAEGKMVLERNLQALDRFLHAYQPYDVDSLKTRLPESYRTEDPNPGKYAENGIRFTQSENPYFREHLIHTTSFGLVVRSRIEAAIAELAYAKGFYIMYEKGITLYGADGYGTTVYTDFILLPYENAPEEDWIYWEHLGLLSQEKYRQQALKKLELYIQNGILPGKNLILTADSLDGAVDMVSIGRILDSFCISS